MFSLRPLLICLICFNFFCTPPAVTFENSGSSSTLKKINKIIAESGLNVNLSIKMIELKSGKTLYSLNSRKLLMPASNNKIYTCAAAIHYLGKDHRFETRVFKNKKNIYLVGGGDPDLTVEELDALAEKTKNEISNIDTLYIDENIMDSLRYGNGWMWDEGSWSYAAPVGPLSVNKNCVDFYVTSGAVNKPAEISIFPNTEFIKYINQSETKNDTTNFKKIKIDRDWPGRTNLFSVSGNVLDTGVVDTLQRNIFDPGYFTGTVFKEQLENKGVSVKNIIKTKNDYSGSLIASHKSDSLLFSAKNMMYESYNLGAELFTKAISLEDTVQGSWPVGLKYIETFLADSAGIDTSRLKLADGSGVSRYTLTNAEQIVKLLSYMYHSKYSEDFLSTFPYGGTDTSLKKRLINTQNHIIAKTGHLSGTSNLSGYIFSKEHGPIAFSILMNGFIGKPKKYQNLQDKIITSL